MNIDKICQVLNDGGLVISPTDTIYGIMGDALNENVIRKIYNVKKRNYNKPLILLMNSFEMIKEYTDNISEIEENAIKKLFPGCVTIILKKNYKINNLITSNTEYVGIRIPNNKDLISIINKLERPIVSTSANISDEDVITNIKMIDENLKRKIDYIEDGGEIKENASTIIKFDNEKLIILREGNLTKKIRNMF
ncbi:MAG: threonylcarbamoyl-AMP synthase [Bacilli bacterium]|nr:threonylcarbamoyl-AMP synthase [Bacilli bacterium]